MRGEGVEGGGGGLILMVTLTEQPTQQDTLGPVLICDEAASRLYVTLERLTHISSHVLPNFEQVRGLEISIPLRSAVSCFLLT